jgi:energy-coupling factor transporter ATP-binding protein EcfA2
MFELQPITFKFKQESKAFTLVNEKQISFPYTGLVHISGHSGSGKSTLLKILKGIIPEYSSGVIAGEILFDGKQVSGEFFKENLKQIIFLFQNPFSQIIYDHPEEEFLFSMENFNFTKEEMNVKIKQLTEEFKLENVWGKKTNQLSHGQCQKLVLASLVAIEPKVLLLDEPTAFLDPKSRLDFYKILSVLKKKCLIVLIDHHQNEIEHLVDLSIHVSIHGKVELHSPKIEEKTEDLSLLNPFSKNEQKIQLELKNYSFAYDDSELLLNQLSMKIENGDCFVLEGENGTGKSTLLKQLAGILKGKKGSERHLWVDNINIKSSKTFDHLGIVFQNPESHFYFDTINEEIDQSLKIDQRLALDLVKLFLGDVNLEKSPFLLSEGEKRRLSILLTVLQNKKIILYDEPTFGQDERSKEKIIELILLLKSLGYVQFFITHDHHFSQKIATQKKRLVNGRLIEIS